MIAEDGDDGWESDDEEEVIGGVAAEAENLMMSLMHGEEQQVAPNARARAAAADTHGG